MKRVHGTHSLLKICRLTHDSYFFWGGGVLNDKFFSNLELFTSNFGGGQAQSSETVGTLLRIPCLEKELSIAPIYLQTYFGG